MNCQAVISFKVCKTSDSWPAGFWRREAEDGFWCISISCCGIKLGSGCGRWNWGKDSFATAILAGAGSEAGFEFFNSSTSFCRVMRVEFRFRIANWSESESSTFACFFCFFFPLSCNSVFSAFGLVFFDSLADSAVERRFFFFLKLSLCFSCHKRVLLGSTGQVFCLLWRIFFWDQSQVPGCSHWRYIPWIHQQFLVFKFAFVARISSSVDRCLSTYHQR